MPSGKTFYTLNEKVFDHPLLDAAQYWLGFIVGDGCILDRSEVSYTISIKLASKDKHHLELLSDFLGYDGWIYPDGNNGVRLRINSVLLANKLSQFGIVPRKTHTVKATEELANSRHFWRGECDADGTLGFRFDRRRPKEVRPFFGITKGSFDLITQAANHFEKKLCLKCHIRPGQGVWRLDLWDHKACNAIRYLYHNCSTALERKLDKAREVLWVFRNQEL